MLALLLFTCHVSALITGPTSSSAEFTLSFSPEGSLGWLVDLDTNQTYYVSPVIFNKPSGTYGFEEHSCIIEPEIGINYCWVTDTHTVTVSTGSQPPSGSAEHVVTTGDYNSDGITDAAVVAKNSNNRLINDFIMRGLGSGTFAVVTNPTSGQISAARLWPQSTATAKVADLSLDGYYDVVITNFNQAIPGAQEHVVWSQGSSYGHPSTAVGFNTNRTNFLQEYSLSQADPHYYDNATYQVCVSYTGFYVVLTYVSVPGWYLDSYLNWIYISQPGFYYLAVYLTAGSCYEVLDSSVVSSVEAYIVDSAWSTLEQNRGDSNALEEIRNVVYDVLNVQIGRDPNPTITEIWIAILHLCDGLGADECNLNFNEELDAGISNGGSCLAQYLVGLTPSSVSSSNFFADEVPHGNTQNFALTSLQRTYSQGNSDSHRSAFWNNRWSISKDPLGPLGVDVVRNAFMLGCLANQRVLAYGAQQGEDVNLTDLGVQIMRGHANSVDLDNDGFIGKLSAEQVAQYHFDAFVQYNLPRRAFGGSPMSGSTAEAARTKFIWCPSCE
ncbi:MAG: VCBS repeat-containing protein [Pseudomonadales bacterium]